MLIRPGGRFSVMRSFTWGERGRPGVGAITFEGDLDEVELDSGSDISGSVSFVSENSPVTDSTVTTSKISGWSCSVLNI